MPDYDGEHFSPPSPTVVVVIQAPSSQGRVVGNVRLQFDTGSDITIVPRWAVNRLDIPPDAIHQRDAMGYDGTVSKVDALDLRILLFDQSFRGSFLILETEIGVIGRDILNHFVIVLDGPRQQWSLQPSL